MNNKNILQEYCQKNNLKIPSYSTYRINNDNDHAPQWFAICLYRDLEYKSLNSETSKKLAELQAATITLTKNNISPFNTNNTLSLNTIRQIDCTDINYVIIADIENVNLLQLNVNKNVLVVGFSCTSFHMIDKYLEKKWNHFQHFVNFSEILSKKNQLNLLTINDKINDLADHYLTAFLCQTINDGYTKYKYIIITNDHAGWCTSRVVKHINNNVNIQNYSSLNILKNEIQDILLS